MHTSHSVKDQETDDLIYSLRERVRDLEKAMGVGYRAPRVLRLTPSQEAVLGVIVARPIVSRKALYVTLYGERPDPPFSNVIQAFIAYVRGKIRPFDLEIGGSWGRGYSMTAEHKAKLQALYTPDEQAQS